MDRLLFAVQWLHVLLGVLWFGYALSIFFLANPALAVLSSTWDSSSGSSPA
jgi:uncharacterized membrane protein